MVLLLTVFSALFSVINPLGAMPVYLALTGNDSDLYRRQQVKKASIYLASILIVFFLIGSYIIDFFSISIESMRIAGGLIISKSGLDLLQSKSQYARGRAVTKEVQIEAQAKNDISFSPLAMPMLAGPGSISLLISYSLEIAQWYDYLIITGAILLNALAAYLILRVSPRLVRFLGESGLSALSRMMGFIVLSIGIQFFINGISPILKGLISTGF